MNNSKNPVPLSAKFVVDPEFFLGIYMAVEDNQIKLARNGIYTAEKLCGKSFWSELSNGDRRLAGICISEMESHKVLNLIEVEGIHEYPKLYQLT
jgi:hypothetical protein